MSDETLLHFAKRIALALERIADLAESQLPEVHDDEEPEEDPEIFYPGTAKKIVDLDGPVDRAGRPMRYTDGTDIPVELRSHLDGWE